MTLPKRLLERAGWLHQEFFVAELKGEYLVLKPLTLETHPPLASLADLRRHFAKIGITQDDVREAVTWAKGPERKSSRRRRSTQ